MTHSIGGGTTSEVLPALAKFILEHGDEVGSRNGRTMEVLNTTIEIDEPIMREILTVGRGANVFAQIAETMWVLSGRNDIEWLSAYLPRAKDFSDDGVSWRGGYGPRIRGGVGWIDQLAHVVNLLRDDPLSRRAVIAIYDPTIDTDPGKDIPCLAGDTALWSPEGDLPIAEVAAKFASGGVTRWPVYAVDPHTREQNIRWATNVWQSGVKQTITLRFDDGSHIRLTPDHRLYIKRRVPSGKRYGSTWQVEEIQAGDLRPGDRVLATKRFYEGKGYERHKKRLDKNTAYTNMRKTHRAYAELLFGPLPEGYDVHHVNGVKTDNRAENLELLSHGEHAALKMFGVQNPMNRLTPEQHRVRAEKQSRSLKEWYASQPDNHVVVAVEPGMEEPVYDFTVPGEHTALIGTGVVAHNCNDFLQFQNRLGELHMTVTVRSNDLFWGWSGINAFEWSTLQEIVASLLGVEVGPLVFNIGSLHIYDRHWERAGRLSYEDVQYDHFRFNPDREISELSEVDDLIVQWFVWENMARKGFVRVEMLDDFSDPLFRAWAAAIAYYWTRWSEWLDMLHGTTLAAAIAKTPQSVLPEPVQRSHGRGPGMGPGDGLKDRTRAFYDFVSNLHATKHKSYGDSWKKRGEKMSILANIARKVDRLGIAIDQGEV